ncbi:chitinase [Mycolicibacterium hodleri]|uniref:Chitinase n=1 Tax=Mycolicibacterium hodleri TaxID=49897 RepID=A0A502EBT5_9MYCO|nr:chitinase [Mycolicibacterium hodleri]TPG35133.1 chitinase [Mycolicibacterium hodleri]
MPRTPTHLIVGLLTAAVLAGCGTAAPEPRQTTQSSTLGSAPGFVVSDAQFEQIFPNRDKFYSYGSLVRAFDAFPVFATVGDEDTRKREAAAFFANVYHETQGLRLVVEANTANYGNYCDAGLSYGCPAGRDSYYGRGPVQLSWNYNYRAAGDSIGLDLLDDPGVVKRDETVAWKTALWFWNTQASAMSATAHSAMGDGQGFGATIRVFNGALECDGHNAAQVQDRVDAYLRIAGVLGVSPGENLRC